MLSKKTNVWGLAAMAVLSAGMVRAERKIISIDGSSTVYPITEAVAEEFNTSRKDVQVTVGISGTGGGFKKFCRGETDISDASRPISVKEMDACLEQGVQYVELPIAFDALTVVIHPENKWAETLTVAQLKKMWEPAAQGTIKKWSQVDPSWPGVELSLYGPGADSGTFDYFTEAVVGKAKASRGDFTASEDDNVLVQGVASDKGGLGYFGFAYFEENANRLKAVKIDGGRGPVSPSETAVHDGTYTPLSRPIFIYVSRKSLRKPEVKEFASFYLRNAQKLSKEVGYIPLPTSAYGNGEKRLDKAETGTAFAGHSPVGMTIDEVLSRPLKK